MDEFEPADLIATSGDLLSSSFLDRTARHSLPYDIPTDAEHQPTTSHFWCIIA
ncbi:hypothetical protein GY45DRAFT_1318623 [Cubamyces sp. BRFM 1775]|nr:hypothetical protein GY45DRAFT_1318623 [Cubamyces sp. BRFM 1775]